MNRIRTGLLAALLVVAVVGVVGAFSYPRWAGPMTGIVDYNGEQFGSANPFPIQGSFSVSTPIVSKAAPVTWTNPSAALSITTSATVLAAGPTTGIITNMTAAGGGVLTLNLSGGTAVNNQGVPLSAGGSSFPFSGQTQTITGVCSTGTCTVAVQSGSQ